MGSNKSLLGSLTGSQSNISIVVVDTVLCFADQYSACAQSCSAVVQNVTPCSNCSTSGQFKIVLVTLSNISNVHVGFNNSSVNFTHIDISQASIVNDTNVSIFGTQQQFTAIVIVGNITSQLTYSAFLLARD